jgi:melatonin receptor type 1B
VITLALSDIGNAVIIMPVAIVISAAGFNVLSDVSCGIIGFIGYTFVLMSLQTTTMIAINRFFCVIKPAVYQKRFNPKSVIVMIITLCCFSVGLMVVIVASGLGNFYFHPGRFVCILEFRDNILERVITSLLILVFVIFPVVIAVVCYTQIYKAVREHKATAEKRLQQASTLSKDEVDVTRSLLAVVLGFVSCWIPCSIVFQLAVYMDLPRGIEMIFIYSNFVSSAINPILYNIYNKPFRKIFFRIFSWKRKVVAVDPAEATNKQTPRLIGLNMLERTPI